jgi:hypothetical protein
MHVKRTLLVAAVLALVTASAAFAVEPGSGSSDGHGLVLAPNPAIGNVRADTAILESQFDFDGGTMPALAADIVAAANGLYGAGVAGQVESAFAARGIL